MKRSTAILLTLILGGFGIQHFYLNRPLAGTLSVLFFWTLVPAVVSCVQLIMLLLMSEQEFHKKYIV